ncbi:MAG: cupredoxin domain-containing protein [Thermoanaerobaculia bacterium]
MIHQRRHQYRLLLLAVLAAALSLTACGGDSGNTPASAGEQTVQVKVTDDRIQMPTELPAGMAMFEVTNSGTHEHSFGITGPGGDKVLEKTLQPGESETLEMTLDAGTYRIYCPVDQKHGDPMQLALNVKDDAAHG